MTDDEARANVVAREITVSPQWDEWCRGTLTTDALRAFMATLFAADLADARRECEQVAERWLAAYPPDIFTEPPPGEHGKTVDGCSARAARYVAKGIADEIRALTTRRSDG